MSDETTTEQLAEIEGQGESTPVTEYTPPEGWRVLAVGEVLQPSDVWVNHEGESRPTKRVGERVNDERYIRRIEPQPESDTELQAQVAFLKGREVTLATRLQQEKAVTTGLSEQLETVKARVNDLETINDAQLKAFTAANKENTALRNQLAAVKAELVQERLERNRWHNQVLRVTAELDEKTTQCEILQIELDAAQQVPADSPELRQLRADLAEVTQDRDTYRHAHELLVNDVNATHQRTQVMTVEAIVEWLVPIRTCGSQALATAVISNLPHIMRSLTGLADEGIE